MKMEHKWLFRVYTWRIIPLSKLLVTPMYKPWMASWKGNNPTYLGDLLTMVNNHLLTGMILQVGLFGGMILGIDHKQTFYTPVI